MPYINNKPNILGNEMIHTLTSGRKYSVRIDATDVDGSHVWGQWDNFEIENEFSRFVF